MAEQKRVPARRGDDVNEYLFDLAAHRAEKNNLIDTRPKGAERLRRLAVRWEAEVKPDRLPARNAGPTEPRRPRGRSWPRASGE